MSKLSVVEVKDLVLARVEARDDGVVELVEINMLAVAGVPVFALLCKELKLSMDQLRRVILSKGVPLEALRVALV